jgi:hypothetical protein
MNETISSFAIVTFDLVLAETNAGINKEARIAMIAITTSNSMRVNPGAWSEGAPTQGCFRTRLTI